MPAATLVIENYGPCVATLSECAPVARTPSAFGPHGPCAGWSALLRVSGCSDSRGVQCHEVTNYRHVLLTWTRYGATRVATWCNVGNSDDIATARAYAALHGCIVRLYPLDVVDTHKTARQDHDADRASGIVD